MQDNNTYKNPTGAATTSTPKSTRLRVMLLILSLAALVGIGGYLAYSQHIKTQVNKPISLKFRDIRSYANSKTDSYSLSVGPGAGLIFSKPLEIKTVYFSPQDSVHLIHYYDVEGKSPIIVQIAATAQKTTLRADEQVARDKTIKQFVDSLQLPAYTSTVNASHPTTTQYIKNNAWLADYTVVQKVLTNKASTAAHLQTVQPPIWHGKVLLAYTPKARYLLMVEASDDNWRTNLETWQKVIDSLRVDQ